MSRHPNLIKAAIASVSANAKSITPNDPIFCFQYNPQTLTRTISNINQDPSATTAATTSAPSELIYLTLELDATDQLEHPQNNPAIVENGLHPALAALDAVVKGPNTKNEPKIILFFWGTKRVLPVQLVDLTVVEEAFDPQLNPIRATIDLCLRVLGINELKKGSISFNLYQNHLNQKASLLAMHKQTISTTAAAAFKVSSTKTQKTPSVSAAKPTTAKAINVKTIKAATLATRKKSVSPAKISKK